MNVLSSKQLSSARSNGTAALQGSHRGAAPAPIVRWGGRAAVQRCVPVVRAGLDDADTGFFSPAFRDALSNAMERDRAAAQDLYSSSMTTGPDYSRADAYSRRREQPSSNTMADALLEVLATALGQSRATLERLQVEEAEIEALIQRERKQVERLEFCLEKVQQDYAYFNTLSRRFEEEGRRSGDSRW